MKLRCAFLICLLLAFKAFGQIDSSGLDIFNTGKSLVTPSSTAMIRGGREITAEGVLRSLVLYIRYKDDSLGTDSWPYKDSLPLWAKKTVDTAVSASHIYTSNNLTDFFERSSGGNGTGDSGKFHFIGDVFYLTTLENEAYYNNNSLLEEIFSRLDDTAGIYNVNFKRYDNWEFMRGDTAYNHFYRPSNGDSVIDYVCVLIRNKPNVPWGGYKGIDIYDFLTNDGVVINSDCGSTTFNAKYAQSPFYCVQNLAHEYGHYLFGGGQASGHFDGYSNGTTSNRGRINEFALMVTGNTGWMSGYEKYRLGWLDPTIVTANTSSLSLKDTHTESDAIIIPMRYDSTTGWLKEYYFIENYHTQRDYSSANPFLVSRVFEHYLTHGLLVFHVENENYNIATSTEINIECADGRWKWKLLEGAGTPYDRSDDLFGRDYPSYNNYWDERHYITISVGGVTYDDYICLKPRLDIDGARYSSNDFLGDNEDFFRIDYNEVFSPYSNPAACLQNGTLKNIGFEILEYNQSNHQYSVKVQIDSAGVMTLSPSKPQKLAAEYNSSKQAALTWFPNKEPNIEGYRIYKAVGDTSSGPGTYAYLATTSDTTYVDRTIYISADSTKRVYYKILAVNDDDENSVFSDTAAIRYLPSTLPASATFDGTYHIADSLVVPSGKTLTIAAGSKLIIEPWTDLKVYGKLKAEGSGSENITFECSDTTDWWGALVFSGGGADSSMIDSALIKRCSEIQYLNNGSDVTTIQNSVLENCWSGIYLYESQPYILGNEIKNPMANGIYGQASGLTPFVYDNTITKDNTHSTYKQGLGVYLINGVYALVAHNDISGYDNGMYFGGDACVWFDKEASAPFSVNNRVRNTNCGIAVAWGGTLAGGATEW